MWVGSRARPVTYLVIRMRLYPLVHVELVHYVLWGRYVQAYTVLYVPKPKLAYSFNEVEGRKLRRLFGVWRQAQYVRYIRAHPGVASLKWVSESMSRAVCRVRASLSLWNISHS